MHQLFIGKLSSILQYLKNSAALIDLFFQEVFWFLGSYNQRQIRYNLICLWIQQIWRDQLLAGYSEDINAWLFYTIYTVKTEIMLFYHLRFMLHLEWNDVDEKYKSEGCGLVEVVRVGVGWCTCRTSVFLGENHGRTCHWS